MQLSKFSLLFSLFLPLIVAGQNPIIQTYYTADPAPMVHGDKVYLYTTHDHDTASTFFRMYDWRAYSSSDMVNWTDHGTILSLEDLSWADDRAWAAQTIYRNGKFYFYFCAHHKDLNQMAIGVAVSDNPAGPFKDALGKPLHSQDWSDIDPTVLIDGSGQAYMYWGNPQLYYVKLNEDMVTYDEALGIAKVPLTEESFGRMEGENKEKRRASYVEGPWLYQRNNLYYLLYPAGGIPEHLAYSVAPSVTGPWVSKGKIMEVIQDGGAFTNHPGLIEFKGNAYLFYHNGALPGGGGFNRSVCLDQFEFGMDGTIPLVRPSKEGVQSIENLNPYQRIEAETIAWSEGVKTQEKEGIGVVVSQIEDGDFIKVKSVDFGSGAKSFVAKVASESKNARIEIRLDSVDGELISTCKINKIGGLDKWEEHTSMVTGGSGVHDVYFVFKGRPGSGLMLFDNWMFAK